MQSDLVARSTVAYPKLVSWRVSKSHKFRGLAKIGACKGVIKVDLNKSCRGGFRATRKPPGYATASRRRGWMGGWLCRTSVAMQSEAHSYVIHGVLPPSMISVVLVPIVKNKRISICSKNNYRPIALASIMSKLLEKIIYERISET